jgi:DNA-binding MarR family transcriptional regulator
MVEKEMLKSPEWKELSNPAKLIYINLKAKYNGTNADKLRLSYTEIKQYLGFSSATITKAFREIEKASWVEKTQMGGLYRFYNLYKLIGKWGRLY